MDLAFDPVNCYMLTVDEAVGQPLMLMYNQYADRAVLSLRRLRDLLGLHTAFTHTRDDLERAMSNEINEEDGLVDLDPMYL